MGGGLEKVCGGWLVCELLTVGGRVWVCVVFCKIWVYDWELLGVYGVGFCA